MTGENERGIGLPIFTVDAFTQRPFGGNPAAVCLLAGDLPSEVRQTIAREMNLSETAFVEKPDEDGCRPLRWFTPQAEVPLCGHATLASAHVLFAEGASDPLRFRTLSGILEVWREEDGRLRMDLPLDPYHPASPPGTLMGALGLVTPPVEVVRSRMTWIFQLESVEDVLMARPDLHRLGRMDPGEGIVGVTLTAQAGEDAIHSRFIAPWVGVDEDPVTGMAHTSLAPYWASRMGRSEIQARQGLDRQGTLVARVRGDRVDLWGSAVTVLRGTIRLP